eukprot:scaffold13466_cov28-Tisochrysis_lutea.AAC.2
MRPLPRVLQFGWWVSDDAEHGIMLRAQSGQRRCPLGHLDQGDAKRPDIHSRIEPAFFNHLRCHPQGRADGSAFGGAILCAGDAKVGQLDLALSGKQQVAGLDVTMHKVALVMEMSKTVRGRRADCCNLRLCKG